MSTFPFVQVEGALALPLTGPLACLPRSFGREWLLTPPHFSLRAELRALYAAMLRTMCLSAEAFRASVSWSDPSGSVGLTPSPVAAPVRQNGGAATMTRGAYAQRTITAPPKPVSTADRSKLTGGAVAIGGAALLAWIVASHTPDEAATVTANTKPRPVASGALNASQRLVNAREQHEHTTMGAVQEMATQPSSSATASSRSVEAAPAGVVLPVVPVAIASHGVGTPVHAPAKSPVTRGGKVREAKRESATARTEPDFNAQAWKKAATPARLVQREARGKERAVGLTSGKRVAGVNASRHQEAHKFAPYREAHPITTHRSAATYSEAKVYSPRQPAANPAEEYASILAYANTYQPSRASNQPSVRADSTDWANHISQRRVTEVPDRFAK